MGKHDLKQKWKKDKKDDDDDDEDDEGYHSNDEYKNRKKHHKTHYSNMNHNNNSTKTDWEQKRSLEREKMRKERDLIGTLTENIKETLKVIIQNQSRKGKSYKKI